MHQSFRSQGLAESQRMRPRGLFASLNRHWASLVRNGKADGDERDALATKCFEFCFQA